MSALRDRFREQVRDEIKAVALTQLAEGGPSAISLNAIARTLGVSGPALYRYFAGRDALLVELVADAYRQLVDTVADARDLATFARRYHDWALAEPHRYRLMLAPPLSSGGELDIAAIAPAHELMHRLVSLPDVPAPPPSAALRRQLLRWSRERPGEIAPEQALGGIQVWATLHGLVTLELDGNFTSMGLEGSSVVDAVIAALRS